MCACKAVNTMSESKHSERDDRKHQSKDDKQDEVDVIDLVKAYFFEDEDFSSIFEKFANDHCEIFDVEDEENKFEYVYLACRRKIKLEADFILDIA